MDWRRIIPFENEKLKEMYYADIEVCDYLSEPENKLLIRRIDYEDF